MKQRYKIILLLVIIFCIALGLRLYNLGEMPAGFHKDEVMSAYFGRFILENGQDLYGNAWPLLYVDKFGDFPPSIPMYFSGLSTYLFGFTVFAARFPVALIGALTIFIFYFFAKELWPDRRIALFSALLIAILPWHIVLSRATAEGIIALPIVLLGLFYVIKFIRQPKLTFLFLSVLFFLFTYFLYPSYRILVPLLLVPLPVLFPLKKASRILLSGVIIFFVLVTISIASTDWGRGRFNQTSMFSTDNAAMIKERVSILAQEEGTNRVSEVKMYHNKYILYTRAVINQYLTYFSPQYLFMAGGLPYRYSVSDEGVLYVVILPLLFLAIFYLRQMKRLGIYLLYLFIISPLPAPLTVDDVPNVHRTLFMCIPLVLMSSFGFITFIDTLKKNRLKMLVTICVFGILFIELIYFLHMYNNHANAVKSFERGDTNKEFIWELIKQKGNYSQVYSPTFDVFPIYYLFFTKNVSSSIIGQVGKNLIINTIDNVTFINHDCPASQLKSDVLQKNILVIDRADCAEDYRFRLIKRFTRHDGTDSYRLLVPKK